MTKSEAYKATPRFLQIVDNVREQIQSGELPEHTALPSERKISEQFDVSRMTARRALLAIETEGLAYSSDRRGRFVSPKRFRYDFGKAFSLSAHAQSNPIDLSIKMVSAEECAADEEVSRAMKIEIGEKLFKLVRLFSIKGHPTFVEVEYLVASLCPNLLKYDLEQSTSLLLEKVYGKVTCSGEVVIRMRPLKAVEAELLGLATYQVGVELEQIACDQDGKPFCYDVQIWRGELAEFSINAIVSES